MSICFFDGKYDTQYRCTYEIKESIIEVEVEYDIDEEIESIDGVKIFGANTEYRKRDVIIVDQQKKMNFLLKNAYFAGSYSVYGILEAKETTKFQSKTFFEHLDLDKLIRLPVTPKVSKIKIFSKAIIDLIGYPSLTIRKSDSEYSVTLSKEDISKSVEIGTENVKKIMVADTWNSTRSRKKYNIIMDFNGYIEIELIRRVNYDLVSEYINELKIFMQLYYPDKFCMDRICVEVNNAYFQFVVPQINLNFSEKYVEKAVDDNLLSFLKKCYLAIPYRKSKADIRNIPYIVIKTSRNLEDNFLMFYRFIECYYKKQQSANIRKTFVTQALKEHYISKSSLSDEQVDKYAREIISLRNRYVHSGYYIKNSSIRVSFEKANEKKNPKDYTVTNVDVHWIYERTKILYKIVIDIIWRNMLGYDEYVFNKHF